MPERNATAEEFEIAYANIMAKFDFTRVVKMAQAVQFGWVASETNQSPEALTCLARSIAGNLLRHAINLQLTDLDSDHLCYTGGFCVYIQPHGLLRLDFTPATYEYDASDYRELFGSAPSG